MSAAAVILAAGESRRLGRPKQLLPVRGVPLLRAIAIEACASSCARVFVVLGARESAIRPCLDGLRVAIVDNPEWTEGIASSVRHGVAAAIRDGSSAVVLLTCDQPALTASHVDALLACPARDAVASRYAGTVGVPARFDRRLFPALLALRGDAGAKRILRAREVAAIDWPEGARDIDTPADVEALDQKRMPRADA